MPDRRPRLLGVKVLVVEDDFDVRDDAVQYLKMEGATVSSAASGKEGFKTVIRDLPDVVVSDLWMPEGDGYGFIARVRALPATMGGLMPVIAMSTADHRRRALSAGFDGFIAKPFDLCQLTDRIAELSATDRAEI